MAFGSTDKLQIVVEVDDKGAVRVLDKLGDEIKGVEKASKEAAGGFTSFQAKLVSLDSAVSLASRGFNILRASALKVADGLKRGSYVDDITSSFKRMSDQAGASGDILLSKFGGAIGNTIPKVEQMRVMNELMLGGLDPGKFEMIGKAARAMGEATGTDAAQGFERLSDSLLRGNTRALKSLGIIINETKEIENFAKAHGRAAEDITEMGRAMALREASIRELGKVEAQFGEITDDAGDKIDQFNSRLTDLKDDALKAAANSKEVNKALDELNGLISESNIDWLVQEIRLLADASSQAWHELKQVAATMVDLNPDNISWLAPGGWQMKIGSKIVDTFRAAAPEAEQAGKEVAQSFITGISELDSQLTQQSLETISQSIQTTSTEVSSLKKVAKQGGKTVIEDLFGRSGQASTEAKKFSDELKTAGQNLDALLGSGGFGQFDKQIEAAFSDDNLGRGEDFKQSLLAIYEAAQKAGIGLSSLERKVNSLAQAEEEAALKNLQQGLDWIPLDDNSASGSLPEGRNPLSSAIDSLTGDPELTDSIQNVGADIANTLFSGLKSGMTGQDYAALAGNIGGQIGGALGAEFGPIGSVVGSFLGEKIIGGIADMFVSEDSEGTKARKAADKYFADLFDANHLAIIVNGQLTELSDLVFNGNTLFGGAVSLHDGPANEYLNSMSGAAQAAFKGVGAAFEEIIGLSEDFDGYLAGALANNLGNLNNLQQALEATGKTFEEIGQAALDAFYNMKLSALELQTALEGIASTMQAGIPDAIGAVDIAYQNMQDAGFKGGRALFDGIRDVGAEAKELGMVTLPQIAEVLINRFGFAAAEVQIFMEAMKVAGIKNVEELANATESTLAAIAANVEAASTGQAMTHTPVNLSTPSSSPSRSYGSSGSSRSGAADEAKRSAEQLRDAAMRALESSDIYASIIEKLTAKQLTQKEANRALREEYRQIHTWMQKLEALEKKRDEDLLKGGKHLGEYTSKIEKLKENLESLTDSGTEGSFNEELLDFMGKFAGQIDLIAVAAQQAGVSFADMKKSAMSGFLSGAETASEAYQKMQDIGPGVSGVTGAVGESYKRMLQSGTHGGIVTMNYLRGMAAETKEFGGTTLDDMLKMLIGQGVSETEASKIMSGLSNAGIDSLDDLEGASDETAINILRFFEEIKVPFDETSESIKNITKELAEIPDSKTIKINLDKGTIDPTLLALLEKFGLLPEGYGDSTEEYGDTGQGLTSRQQARYNYLLRKYGKTKADEFLRRKGV